MIEQIEHIKKFALQDNSALSVQQLGEAIARMCDDAIHEAAQQGVQADVVTRCANCGTMLTDGGDICFECKNVA